MTTKAVLFYSIEKSKNNSYWTVCLSGTKLQTKPLKMSACPPQKSGKK